MHININQIVIIILCIFLAKISIFDPVRDKKENFRKNSSIVLSK